MLYLSMLNVYKFQLFFRVTRTFQLPHFQGPAIRNLLSGFKERQPGLNNFFFEQKFEYEKIALNGYAVHPAFSGHYTHYRNTEFSFYLTVFGHALQHFSNVLQLMPLTGFSDLGKRLEIQRVEYIISDTERKEIASFSEAKPFVVNSEERIANSDVISIGFDTPVCLKNTTQAVQFTFNRLINVAAHRTNALLALFGENGPLFDVVGLSELARHIETTDNQLKPFIVSHYSKPIKYHAFVGNITFKGNFEPFLPLLHLTENVHLGKETASGLGKIRIGNSLRQAVMVKD